MRVLAVNKKAIRVEGWIKNRQQLVRTGKAILRFGRLKFEWQHWQIRKIVRAAPIFNNLKMIPYEISHDDHQKYQILFLWCSHKYNENLIEQWLNVVTSFCCTFDN